MEQEFKLEKMKRIVVLLLVSAFLVSCEKPSDCFESTGNFITKEFPAAAFHTVYIKDLNGCGVAEKKIAVLGLPKFWSECPRVNL